MQENSQVRDGYLVEPVSSIAEFDQDAFVKKLIEKVSSQLGAVSLDSRNTPVVIENKAMGSLLACYSGLFSGSLIAKGISPIAGRLHEQIFSDKITIIDNPRNQDAIFMQNYDDEGHPTYSKVVVNHGVFELMLHNTKSALKMNASSTGNGFKSGAGATGVSPMNMYIEPGKDSLDELLAQMKDGVLITDLAGMHAGVDFVSGNFSLQAQGYLIENGKKTKALTLITIAGNFLDLMNKVQAVGNDLEWKTRAIASPSILFSQASIGGNE
jgi:PmbA protein